MGFQHKISDSDQIRGISENDMKTLAQDLDLGPRMPAQAGYAAEQAPQRPAWSIGTVLGAIMIVAIFVSLALAAEVYDVSLFEECYVHCEG